MEQRGLGKGHKKAREKTVTTGSKVVCVDDRFPPDLLAFYNALPIKDRQYVVRGIGIGVNLNGEAGEVVVYLEGLNNPCSTTRPTQSGALHNIDFERSNQLQRRRQRLRSLRRL